MDVRAARCRPRLLRQTPHAPVKGRHRAARATVAPRLDSLLLRSPPSRPACCAPSRRDPMSLPTLARTSESRRPALVRARRREAASPALVLPAVMADERNETHGRFIARRDLTAFAFSDDESLLLAITDRDEQSPAVGQLIEQRLRD